MKVLYYIFDLNIFLQKKKKAFQFFEMFLFLVIF